MERLTGSPWGLVNLTNAAHAPSVLEEMATVKGGMAGIANLTKIKVMARRFGGRDGEPPPFPFCFQLQAE